MLQTDTTPASTTPASAPVADTPAPSPVETKAVEAAPVKEAVAEPVSLDDELSKAYRKATTPRADGGKFAPKNPADPAKQATEAPTVEDPAQAANPSKDGQKPAIEPPRAWPAEAKAKFAALPPDLQQVVAQRETELHEIKSQYGRVNSEATAFQETYKPFGQYLQAVGMTPPQFMKEALTTSYMLDTQPEVTIKHLARQYGVDLLKLVDMNEPAPNPQVAALARENQILKQRQATEQEQRAAYEQAARESQYVSIVDRFLASKPDAAKLQRELGEEIAAIKAANPNAGPQEVLEAAYERALWLNPETRAARIKQESETAERARVEAAKKAADAARQAKGVNVNGAVIAGASGDLDADLRSIWRRNANR